MMKTSRRAADASSEKTSVIHPPAKDGLRLAGSDTAVNASSSDSSPTPSTSRSASNPASSGPNHDVSSSATPSYAVSYVDGWSARTVAELIIERTERHELLGSVPHLKKHAGAASSGHAALSAHIALEGAWEKSSWHDRRMPSRREPSSASSDQDVAVDEEEDGLWSTGHALDGTVFEVCRAPPSDSRDRRKAQSKRSLRNLAASLRIVVGTSQPPPLPGRDDDPRLATLPTGASTRPALRAATWSSTPMLPRLLRRRGSEPVISRPALFARRTASPQAPAMGRGTTQRSGLGITSGVPLEPPPTYEVACGGVTVTAAPVAASSSAAAKMTNTSAKAFARSASVGDEAMSAAEIRCWGDKPRLGASPPSMTPTLSPASSPSTSCRSAATAYPCHSSCRCDGCDATSAGGFRLATTRSSRSSSVASSCGGPAACVEHRLLEVQQEEDEQPHRGGNGGESDGRSTVVSARRGAPDAASEEKPWCVDVGHGVQKDKAPLPAVAQRSVRAMASPAFLAQAKAVVGARFAVG